MNHQVIGRFLKVSGEHLVISIGAKLNRIAYSNIDNTEKTLVLLLELFLVEDLDSQNAVLGHPEVEALVPVRVKSPLGDLRGLRLFAIDRNHGEWIRKPEDISLV